ncbi:MAG TPA: hypothetical protein VGO11_08385, partial [Chthoniobacteraceae bacterium]|nr:hypothetical protein [Chthoniobacteraceae bacterium]
MLARSLRPLRTSPRFRRTRRLWRTLLIAVCPVVLLAQTTTVFELPMGRAGHTFSARPVQPGIATVPLTLEITDTVDDGNGGRMPTATSRLKATAGQSLLTDYFLFDENTWESTAPNRLGSVTFFRRSFVAEHWFNGTEPSTNFFVSLPEARLGHQFSIYTANTSSILTLSPALSYLGVDASGNQTTGSYGFFEGWTSMGPASDSPYYFVIDHDAAQMTGALTPATSDLINLAWGPLTSSPITHAIDVVVSADNRNATLTLHCGQGYVQNLYPLADANGAYHVAAVIGMNQDFWLVRAVDGAVSPTSHLGFFDESFDLTAAFPPNPAVDDDAGSNSSGNVAYLKIPASRWDHTFVVLDVHDIPAGSLSIDHMQGFWSVDQHAQSWFTSYYYLDATAYTPGPGWRLWDTTTNDFSVRNPRDLTAWIRSDANMDSDGDTLVDWYERLIGSNPFATESDGDQMPDKWEAAWGFNPANGADGDADEDGDGLSNRDEYLHHTNPRNRDTDGDGMPDGWEVLHGLDPLVNDA